MYYLAIAVANKHEAQFGPSKGKMVENDAYRQVPGQPKSIQQAIDGLLRLIGTSKPGTKVKLVVTVPWPVEKPAAEMSREELQRKIAELTALAAQAA